jgi:hypothetical protein
VAPRDPAGARAADQPAAREARRRRQAPVTSDQEGKTVQEEDRQNRQPLDLSDELFEPTKAVHAAAAAASSQDAVGQARDGG